MVSVLISCFAVKPNWRHEDIKDLDSTSSVDKRDSREVLMSLPDATRVGGENGD